MFLSAVCGGGCRDILPLGQLYKELPKCGLARCPSARRLTFYTFLTDGCISLPRPCGQSGNGDRRLGTVTDKYTQRKTRDTYEPEEQINAHTHTCMWRYKWLHQEGRKKEKHTHADVMLMVRPNNLQCLQNVDKTEFVPLLYCDRTSFVLK